MEGGKNYFEINNLEVYRLSRAYGSQGWKIYCDLDWHSKKIIGDQAITSIDSVGANIAEGYGRFHYLDKNKFYYNARGSLIESQHWIDLMTERKLISQEILITMKNIGDNILIKLNALIKSQFQLSKARS